MSVNRTISQWKCLYDHQVIRTSGKQKKLVVLIGSEKCTVNKTIQSDVIEFMTAVLCDHFYHKMTTWIACYHSSTTFLATRFVVQRALLPSMPTIRGQKRTHWPTRRTSQEGRWSFITRYFIFWDQYKDKKN